ncbi:ML domain-containing protein [Streptomyces sp. BE230]|uniref:ML domain-containing protein n=1 Tax=Streptomyces sp. BE230 TaxID=3002526 RepID=UPI002ED16D01|nr:ML domain-containing protein [Streptomyces sp. BE230]
MTTWTNAGSGSDSIQIAEVAFAPETPVKGQAFTLTLTGTLRTPISKGRIDTTVKYGVISLFKDSAPLAAAAAGDYTAQQTISVPADSPSGKYTGTLTLTDQENREISSFNISFSL